MRPNLFKKRLETFYSSWRNFKEDRWGNSDVLFICMPPEDSPGDDDTHPISSSFLNWLIGDRFPGTVAIFAQNEIFFLCINNESLSVYKTLVGAAMEALRVHVHATKSKDEDSSVVVEKVLRMLKAKYRAQEQEPLIIGCILGETLQSKISWNCMQKLKQNKYQIATVNDGFRWLCTKDHENADDFAIQMLSLPEKVAEMLSMSPKAEEQEPSTALFGAQAQQLNQKSPNSEQKGKIGAHISLQGEGGEKSSKKSGCGDGDGEGDEDEWILVDADEDLKQIERARNIWKRLPLS